MTNKSDELPGRWDLAVVRGDMISKTLTITGVALSPSGWRGQIRSTTTGDLVDEWTVDATDAADGIIQLSLPVLAAGRYRHEIECQGDRTYLSGHITVVADVSNDDD